MTPDDGTQVEDLITSGLGEPVGISMPPPLDEPGNELPDILYVTDLLNGRIMSANPDGSGLTEIVTGLSAPSDILGVIGPSPAIIWADSTEGKVQMANPDGTGVTDLITTGLGEPSGLALDSQRGTMYITDSLNGRILRANLDGTGLTELVSGLENPLDIAFVVPEPTTLTLLALAGLSSLRRRRCS